MLEKHEKINERIIKIYQKGNRRYYFIGICVLTISNFVIFYLSLKLMELNLLKLEGKDWIYLFLDLLLLIFINKNILIPVTFNWKMIEEKYNEILENKKQEN